MRVHHEKERWGKALPWQRAMGLEFTIRKSDGVRVHNEKKSDGVRVYHERKSNGVRVHHEKKSNGVKLHPEKVRWGETLQ